MEYRHVNGPVYCRYASTPPILNSDLALRFGILAPSTIELESGRNVKLRILLEKRSKRMTCHGKIDWVKPDEAARGFQVGFSRLSFTDEEFKVLIDHFGDTPEGVVELATTLRDKGVESEPVVVSEKLVEIKRVKAVTLPVSLIEEVDSKRGDIPFSEFITRAVTEYVRRNG